MSRQGFDPGRVADGKRDRPIIPQILSSDAGRMAKGFTEIKVIGLGGSGNNTVDRMIDADIQGIDFVAANSDMQALSRSLARKRVRLGDRLTHGLGTGGDAKLGERAAEAAVDGIMEAIEGADMVFVTAGLGRGTGTGAAPVVARTAQRLGALTVGIVTLPFSFEGSRRRSVAHEGLTRLRPYLDSLIVVSNDRLLSALSDKVNIQDAFGVADETLKQGIHGIADLVLTPGLINLDFADVRSVMYRAGSAMMGMGTASGEGRARRAAQAAITSRLLDASVAGARGLLLNVTGGPTLSLHEVHEAAELITAAAAPDSNIIFGAVIHPRLRDEVRVTVIATGFERR